jgi:hypothetical protein
MADAEQGSRTCLRACWVRAEGRDDTEAEPGAYPGGAVLIDAGEP